MDEIPRILPADVSARLRRGEPLSFIDARSEAAWQRSQQQIPGSVRVSPHEIDREIGRVPRGSAAIAYCT